jgi:hypothetical protein
MLCVRGAVIGDEGIDEVSQVRIVDELQVSLGEYAGVVNSVNVTEE